MTAMHRSILALTAVTAVITIGCGGKSAPTNPHAGASIDAVRLAPGERGVDPGRAVPDPDDFVSRIDNPYLPLIPGTVFEYHGTTDGSPEIDRIHVTRQKKTILGVACTVVQDSVYVNGFLHEATIDWYAQDEEGTVWYLGEDSKEFDEQGLHVISTEGSWEAGVRGAKPGIVMEDEPRVGDQYRQEFARKVAEDMAEVLDLNASVKVPFGSFTHCLRTKEWTPLDPGVVEHKLYARGVGMVKALQVAGGSDHSELVKVWTE